MGHAIVLAGRHERHPLQEAYPDRVTVEPWDLYRSDEWGKLISCRYDGIVHAAWGNVRNVNSIEHIHPQLGAHIEFLRHVAFPGQGPVTVLGTCYEYGLQEGCLDETAPTQPITSYGIAKLALCHYLGELCRQRDVSWRWLRIFFTYGLGQHLGSLLPLLDAAIARGNSTFAMSPGQQVRDYLSASELGRLVAAASIGADLQGIYNVCSGEPVTLEVFVRRYLAERWPESSLELDLGAYPYSSVEPFSFWGDPSRLRRALGVDND